MSEGDHGIYGCENRSFLKDLYKAEKPRVLMKLIGDVELPSIVDLRQNYKVNIYDQGKTSSCTAHALASAYAIMTCQQKKNNYPIYLSRLFIYYNERKITNHTNVDQGAYIKDGTQTLKKDGSCLESLFPFDANNVFTKPSDNCYSEALKHTCNSIEINVDYVNQFKIALSKNIPVICGIMVYDSFQSNEVAKNGNIPYPDTLKEKLLGGHAICIVGYDDSKKLFTFQNSWSPSWGDMGYGYLPYKYIDDQNLTADCHIITDTEIVKSTPSPKPIPQPFPQPYPQYINCPYHPIPCPFHPIYPPFPHTHQNFYDQNKL